MIVVEIQNQCKNCAQPVAQRGPAAKFIIDAAPFTGEAPVLDVSRMLYNPNVMTALQPCEGRMGVMLGRPSQSMD
jgi:hypothetical protein